MNLRNEVIHQKLYTAIDVPIAFEIMYRLEYFYIIRYGRKF